MRKRLFMSRFFRGYFAVVISLLVILAVFAEVREGPKELIALLVVGSVLALLTPFSLARALARRAVKTAEQDGPMRFLLEGHGYGGKSDTFEFYVKWEAIERIEETNKFIFLRLGRGGCLTIFKYLLPRETVSAIKGLLATVPVKDKRLLS
ncbi:MAG: YcxB family protein [Planctomycetota bacterium]